MAKLLRRITCRECGETVEPTKESEHDHMKACKCGKVRIDIGGPVVREYLVGAYYDVEDILPKEGAVTSNV